MVTVGNPAFKKKFSVSEFGLVVHFDYSTRTKKYHFKLRKSLCFLAYIRKNRLHEFRNKILSRPAEELKYLILIIHNLCFSERFC